MATRMMIDYMRRVSRYNALRMFWETTGKDSERLMRGAVSDCVKRGKPKLDKHPDAVAVLKEK